MMHYHARHQRNEHNLIGSTHNSGNILHLDSLLGCVSARGYDLQGGAGQWRQNERDKEGWNLYPMRKHLQRIHHGVSEHDDEYETQANGAQC